MNDDTTEPIAPRNIHRERLATGELDLIEQLVALHDRCDLAEAEAHDLRERIEWLERAVSRGAQP
ncbi:MAG TPA: hypothetical protein VGL71_03190 [Urbifossiella sp.]